MTRIFLLLIAGLLLHFKPCNGSPAFLFELPATALEQSNNISFSNNLLAADGLGLPEGFNATESTGLFAKRE
jgi:hypothetical protein